MYVLESSERARYTLRYLYADLDLDLPSSRRRRAASLCVTSLCRAALHPLCRAVGSSCACSCGSWQLPCSSLQQRLVRREPPPKAKRDNNKTYNNEEKNAFASFFKKPQAKKKPGRPPKKKGVGRPPKKSSEPTADDQAEATAAAAAAAAAQAEGVGPSTGSAGGACRDTGCSAALLVQLHPLCVNIH